MTTIALKDGNDGFDYKKGNISTTQTIEKEYTTIAKAKARSAKMENCIAFCVESQRKPSSSSTKEYMIHYKEGQISVYESKNWHTYLCPV